MRYARICSVTGKGINQGYVTEDLSYFKYKKDLTAHLREFDRELSENYPNNEDFLNECYENEFYYYTEWEEDYEWQEINGRLVEL